MHWFEQRAQRIGKSHVQFFVPSVDRDGNPIAEGQDFWVHQCLEVMGTQFGGATAFPPAKGVWRDDERDGRLVFEDTVVVFAYALEAELSGEGGAALYDFAMRLGATTNQGEVGVFVDGEYFGFHDFEPSEGADEEVAK